MNSSSTVFKRFPDVLKNPEYRFILVRRHDKGALEKNWNQPEHQYEHTEPKFQYHLQNDYNYGVLPGFGDLCILDADEPERLEALGILDIFRETFTVKTRKGFHYYFLCSSQQHNKIPIFYRGDHLGEFYINGAFYCVGPGCIHPSGALYQIEQDAPLMRISAEELEAILDIFDKKPEKREVPAFTNFDRNDSMVSQFGMQIHHLVPLGKQVGNGEYVDSHPVHGSTTGTNFSVNPSKNLWCCRRCNSGGDPLTLLAVMEGIIDCPSAQSGCLSHLTHDEWQTLLDACREKGYKVDDVSKKKKSNLPKWMEDSMKKAEEIVAARNAQKTKIIKNVSDFKW